MGGNDARTGRGSAGDWKDFDTDHWNDSRSQTSDTNNTDANETRGRDNIMYDEPGQPDMSGSLVGDFGLESRDSDVDELNIGAGDTTGPTGIGTGEALGTDGDLTTGAAGMSGGRPARNPMAPPEDGGQAGSAAGDLDQGNRAQRSR